MRAGLIFSEGPARRSPKRWQAIALQSLRRRQRCVQKKSVLGLMGCQALRAEFDGRARADRKRLADRAKKKARQRTTTRKVKLPLLPSGPGGVRLPSIHSP